MEALHTLTRLMPAADVKQNGVAFSMLGISLFALYTGLFLLVIVPLMWMVYRVGKEMGRQEAHEEIVHAGADSLVDYGNR